MGTRGPLKLAPTLRAVTDADAAETMHARMRPTAPKKPDDLMVDISELWDELVEHLDEAGLISAVDGPALELALRHFIAARVASTALILEGPTVYDEKNERTAKNPASQVFRDHSTAFLEFAKQLGLSFASRARVSTPKEPEHGDGNPFAVGG